MKYGDKVKLGLVPSVYGKLSGIPEHQRTRANPPLPAWSGKYHRWPYGYWKSTNHY